MDIDSAKINLVQKILNIQKASILEEINKFLDEGNINAYSSEGKPLDREAYIKSIDKSRQEVHLGKLSSQEEIEKRSENW